MIFVVKSAALALFLRAAWGATQADDFNSKVRVIKLASNLLVVISQAVSMAAELLAGIRTTMPRTRYWDVFDGDEQPFHDARGHPTAAFFNSRTAATMAAD